MSKQQLALYYVHHQTMQREKCSWRREYFELTADGKCSSVSETEDKIFYRLAYTGPHLPPGAVISTRQAYRNTVARMLVAERARLHRDKEARKLLRGGMSRHEHASREAGATVATPEPVLVPAVVVEEPADVLADYTVFDCETTGFSHEKDHLLELAATRYTNGKPVDSMQSFVRFTGFIPPRITSLTTITTQHVFRAPDVKEVLQAFRRVVGDSLLVGHNVAFDLRFVNAARARLGAPAPLPNRFLCTQVVATSRYPDISHKLGELCQRFKIPSAGAHRAMADVLMTAKLLQYLHAQQPIAPHLVGATSAPKPKAPAAQPALFA